MRRLAGSPFLWLAALLALGEVAAWRALPYRLVPTAAAAIRNPLNHRGWPEYLDAPADGRPLAVLISNSQGLGGEMEDARAIYAAALRAHLAGRGYRFENWSVTGLRTVEIELLARKAIARGARHVLMVVTVNNFEDDRYLELSWPLSDVPLLAGEPALWRHLPGARFVARSAPGDYLLAAASLRSSLVRSRVAMTDLAASRVSDAVRPLLFGRETRPGKRFDGFADAALSPYFATGRPSKADIAARQALRAKRIEEWSVEGVAERFATFARIYPPLKRRLDAAGIGLTWVWHPMAPGTGTPENRAALRWFIAGADPILARSGVRPHDTVDLLGRECFATQGHLSAIGHREFAAVMIGIADAALAAGGRR